MAAVSSVCDHGNAFAMKLFKVLSASSPDKNTFVSPLSLQVVLAMAYTGARGQTASEISDLLMLPNNGETVLPDYNSLLKSLEAPELHLATRMFVENHFDIKKEFNDNAAQNFKSDALKVDFLNDSSGSRKTINTWVEKQTNNKIQDLIQEGVLNADTVLVLVNAVHFLADWVTPFPAYNTRKEKFFISETDTVDVDMMSVTDEFMYKEHADLDAKILQLPYKNERFSMFIVLPNKKTGLPELESKLSDHNLIHEFMTMERYRVVVNLPKFKLSTTIELNEILEKMGASSMFSFEKADFSGISDGKIFVSKVVQKAFVDVNEKGTEAAAATGMVFNLRCAPMFREEPKLFKADHPYLFVITKHIPEQLILFAGKFYSSD